MEPSSADRYHSIAKPSEGLYKEKGSRFIALAYPIRSESEVQPLLEEVRRTYHDARHHCYAWRLGIHGEPYRVNDDGEPSGSAGRPILGQMMSMELSDLLVIVVRYFGGVKLGVGGLVQAYRAATREALDAATLSDKEIRMRFAVVFEYPRMNEVMRFVRESGLEIESTDFAVQCSLTASIRESRAGEVRTKAASLFGFSLETMDKFVYSPK
ncbi:MAG TPA: YigZ family protein [Bacteroidales bacterium]|nr:YigZ family protein [Bacteroidales bacterium]